ncbi:hypothetical protein ACFYXM_34085 [Streptomyces sp. NPDC002476]|uniref:hypothetical protein n=1 Tax=Streptomyces sp. NPDC002476 TaxID=3364648 RepID=UPI00367D780E
MAPPADEAGHDPQKWQDEAEERLAAPRRAPGRRPTVTADAYLVIRCDANDPAASDGQCDTEHSWPVRVAHHTELRRLLSTRGWHRPRPGRDICPDCWKQGRR